jgi:hypothetical protein
MHGNHHDTGTLNAISQSLKQIVHLFHLCFAIFYFILWRIYRFIGVLVPLVVGMLTEGSSSIAPWHLGTLF